MKKLRPIQTPEKIKNDQKEVKMKKLFTLMLAALLIVSLAPAQVPGKYFSFTYDRFWANDGTFRTDNTITSTGASNGFYLTRGTYSGAFTLGATGVLSVTAAQGVAFASLTATTVPYLNASKILTSSSVTPTELGYVSGVTSGVQSQLNTKIGLTALSSSATGLTYTNTTGVFSLTTGYMIPGAGTAGQLLTSAGASAPAWTTATYPATATTTGAYLRADGTNWIASTLILPNAGTIYKLPVYSAANTITELTAVGATGEYLAGATGAIPAWATLNQAAVAGLTTASTPTFSGLTFKGSGTFNTTFQAGAASASKTYTLPLTDGTAGQALVTDGSTVLSWSTTTPSLLSFSSAATGLTYTNTTGVFSLTAGYVIPTTTEQTKWNLQAQELDTNVALAADGVLVTTIAAGSVGIVMVKEVTALNQYFLLTPTTVGDTLMTNAAYSATKDNALTLNVYVEGGVVKLQNKTALAINVKVGFVGFN